ncbi:hypothetical protein Nepgr_014431 [Nepenthes gracilis]|uniref:LYR motif containing domain-containing protein n=1 Tax=Nepenthes gracilis TaxID=150966 RepID=A0AAD3SJ50_NEPGR|nr:hypothetical protein Nepgr_014431 [Nepenthes gracilis]
MVTRWHINDSLLKILECKRMAKGLIWATTEDLVRNRARLAKKAELRAIFMLASEERSLHNIADLIDAAEYSLSLLRKGEIPKYIQ